MKENNKSEINFLETIRNISKIYVVKIAMLFVIMVCVVGLTILCFGGEIAKTTVTFPFVVFIEIMFFMVWMIRIWSKSF
ncbi:hypothetical protein KAU40_02040 [Candidatus Parcubacteria bacterium]|nr:hypothetical protein [Candidatus Parcubacteria bacterium]